MEAEARTLLTTALAGRRPARGLGSYIRDQFTELGGVELPIADRSDRPRATHLEP